MRYFVACELFSLAAFAQLLSSLKYSRLSLVIC